MTKPNEELKNTSDEPCEEDSNASSGDKMEDESKPQREPVDMTITDIELERLTNEAKEFKDKYLRVLAEAENARKRLTKEKQEMIQYSMQNVICDFLIPIDQMEHALKHTENQAKEVKQWSVGFEMILTHFKDVLANNHVKAFDSVGEIFDPHLHEAVEVVESSEYPEGIVVEEIVKGYKMGDKVIRPSRVKVSGKASEQIK